MANGERTRSSPEPQTKQDLDHIPSHGNIAGLPALKNVWWTDWRDPNMIWENVSLFSRSSEQDYNNPPARFVSCPPLVIYWGFLQGEKVMADLLLVFHINYINGVGWEAEMGTDIPRSYTDQSVLINNTLMYGNISHPRPWAAWVMIASRNGAVSETISHKTDRME